MTLYYYSVGNRVIQVVELQSCVYVYPQSTQILKQHIVGHTFE